MSTGAKTALGILGAIVIGTVIHEATDDDDDDRGRDDARSPPARQPPEDAPPPSDDRRPPPGRVQRQPYPVRQPQPTRSEAHTSELQSLMRSAYALFCLNNKNIIYQNGSADV